MKSLMTHTIILIILLSISFLYADKKSSGEIAVRLTSTNSITAGSSNGKDFDISINNNSILGWRLTAESKNKGMLVNEDSKLSYAIKIGNDKKDLSEASEILSIEGFRNISTTKFELMMEIDSNEIYRKESILIGTYKDTINLTLYSND